MKNILLISAFLFNHLWIVGSNAAAKDYVPRSKDILDLMKQRNSGKLLCNSTAVFPIVLTQQKLAGVQDRMVATAGPLKGVDSISTDHQENYDVVIQHCVFEKEN
ncbi:MAG: hypothetical protein IPJ66_18035 [Bacteroidetes bacterium]|nr:hypothetical protein [Bacteroidota bacterium]